MSSTEFHPDLRRVGRFLPKQVITPRRLPISRLLDRLLGGRGRGDVDLVLPKTDVSRAFFDTQCTMLRRAFAPK